MLTALKNIFAVNLGLGRTERVLVFTDRILRKEALPGEDRKRRERLRDAALLVSEIGRAYSRETVYFEYPSTGGHGIEPPAALWERAFGKKAVSALKRAGLLGPLLRKKLDPEKTEKAEAIIKKHARPVDAVVALSNYSTTHTSFRRMLTGLCGARYASMPIFEVEMLEGPMDVDYRALEKRTVNAARVLSRAVSVKVTTPNGTELSFSTKGRAAKADTGIIKRPGSTSNLPAGEAYLAPVEGTARGLLVIEWAPTRKLSSPVKLKIEEGSVAEISGRDPYVVYLENKLSERAENANIAEFGVGTNERARRPDNILESEKILGTVHIALGDNSSFGGRVETPFHQDFVFFRPTVTLTFRGGQEGVLLKNGKLLL